MEHYLLVIKIILPFVIVGLVLLYLVTFLGEVYMGIKLSWTGLAITLSAPVFGLGTPVVIAGVIVLIIGVVLQWLDK